MTPTLTIAQVANALQVSPDTVRAWWADRRWPDGEPMARSPETAFSDGAKPSK